MPPNLRPRKKANVDCQPIPPLVGPPNLTGLAALPPELLLEIVNHLPRFPVPCDYLGPPMITPVHTRHSTLIILVQICSSLRTALVHQLWEDIELFSLYCGQRNTPADPKRICTSCLLEQNLSSESYFAFKIVSQLETVTVRVPEYAACVQTLTIFLPVHSAETIVPEFAECLTLLPNLRTLQFYYNIYNEDLCHVIRKRFARRQYKNIKTLVIPADIGSMTLLEACANVSHLHFTSTLLFRVSNVFVNIEKLTGILPHPHFNRIGDILPNLKRFQLRSDSSINLRGLSKTLAQLSKPEVVEIAIISLGGEHEADILKREVGSIIDQTHSGARIRRRVEVWDHNSNPPVRCS
ncbi:hypothetical protein BDN72DRAFT_405478 [Pluteus cervinus]|uniref:Uncharacterized protein n=1 Tax=Pluteus cervinus TaxID=181527 RepID=A0ACD3A9F2_9AGAR|nr:hypothetical protein BDN72DRAFT_405478 [Pluteus cervinus]